RLMRTSEDERAWNAGEVDILLAHPASAAFGLNLQDGGHHVIWFGLTWSLELYQQANKRLHRQGQTSRVIVHRLVVEQGMDEDVITALKGKGDTQDALLDALKARIGKVKTIRKDE
ncbi:MAG: DEAD/DEAH box helicase, partial [Clostridia bacterium]